MVNADILATKVMHNFALLGTDFQNFENGIRNSMILIFFEKNNDILAHFFS